MDDSLRELGTGDIVVGKKVRRAAAGFYERARDYRLALMEGDGALGQALVRHGLARTDASRETRALCGYVRAAAAALQRLDSETVQGARLEFPDVAKLFRGYAMTAPLAWSHRTTEIPEAGLQVTRTASPAERAAISRRARTSCRAMPFKPTTS